MNHEPDPSAQRFEELPCEGLHLSIRHGNDHEQREIGGVDLRHFKIYLPANTPPATAS
jgi:hypothetical protein